MLTRKIIGLTLALGLTVAAQAQPLRSHEVPQVVEHLTRLYGSTVNLRATPLAQKDPLGHLLGLQRRHWPAAWVSSTFYDWRTVSKYRRNAGLHLGYDLALPYGTPVATGWAGTVTAVTPWTETEYGVTVTDASGLSVTYGHVTPDVFVGQRLATGQTLGRIASDHVDVKMRDAEGRYIPFGEDSRGVSAAVGRPVTRQELLTAWLVARNSLDQAEEELFLRRNASTKRKLQRRSAKNKIAVLEQTLAELRSPESEGLVSRRSIEEFKAELQAAKTQLQRLDQEEKTPTEALESTVDSARANLQAVENWARTEGLRWSDVEQLVARTITTDKKLTKTVVEEKTRSAQAAHLTLEQLQKRVGESEQRLSRLEQLYTSGGLSRQEIEDQRLRHQLLQEEYRLRRQRASR